MRPRNVDGHRGAARRDGPPAPYGVLRGTEVLFAEREDHLFCVMAADWAVHGNGAARTRTPETREAGATGVRTAGREGADAAAVAKGAQLHVKRRFQLGAGVLEAVGLQPHVINASLAH
jgi:hypothetical protein